MCLNLTGHSSCNSYNYISHDLDLSDSEITETLNVSHCQRMKTWPLSALQDCSRLKRQVAGWWQNWSTCERLCNSEEECCLSCRPPTYSIASTSKMALLRLTFLVPPDQGSYRHYLPLVQKKRCTFSVWRKWHDFAVFTIFVFFSSSRRWKNFFPFKPFSCIINWRGLPFDQPVSVGWVADCYH